MKLIYIDAGMLNGSNYDDRVRLEKVNAMFVFNKWKVQKILFCILDRMILGKIN